MQYQGGKSRIARQLAEKIRELHPTTTEIWEPFCGGGAMTLALAKVGFRVHASDNHEDLILMWQALLRGETEPFADVTQEEHSLLKKAPSSARRGFVRFGSSFGGDFNGGFAFRRIAAGKLAKHQPFQEARNSLLRIRDLAVSFELRDYTHIPSNVLVYADPPYLGTYDYQGRTFDHSAFWQWVRARVGPIFVSELIGPEDLSIVWRREHKSQMVSNVAKTEGKVIHREERLYYKPPSALL